MQACCFAGIETVQTRSIADAEIMDPTDAIIQVELAGLCGSDLHPFFGRETGLDDGTVMGHEFVGKIVAVGDAVKEFQIGDRVCCPFSSNCGECYYCRIGLTSRCESGQLYGWVENGVGLHGGQSEWVRAPLADGSLVKIPDELSAEWGLLLGDNLSTGFYCAEMADIQPGGVYVVLGCGTVGQLAIVASLAKGAETVLAYDPDPQRQQQAEMRGASVCRSEQDLISQVKHATGGRGADGVMELVGLFPAQQLAYQVVRPGGILSTIGCHCTPHFGFSPAQAYDKNVTYKTGRCPARYFMPTLLEQIGTLGIRDTDLITHRFPVKDAGQAYEVFSKRKDGCIKAVFDFS